MIAVIVPAHNESEHLGNCLRSIKRAAVHPALRGETVRTIVVLDSCTDNTAAIAADAGVETLEIDARSVGVARATGARRAIALGARWLCSTDADSRVPADWIGAHLGAGSDAVCGTIEIDDWLDRPTSVVEQFRAHYRPMDGHRHIHGANLGLSVPAYVRAGGFEPLEAHEDVALVRSLERQGARIAWLGRPCVMTSARRIARAPHGFAAFLNKLAPHAMVMP